eukprot:gb/GEZN01019004.1/.p1 GENE.gb/GEZN01019004.1/~~gb/GEZN01019004.1/.p1  ORF type:complete len:109 (+),score=3.65 gb/GEZN01019004.1/:32-358(+)
MGNIPDGGCRKERGRDVKAHESDANAGCTNLYHLNAMPQNIDSMWCHHFTAGGKHCVLNNLPSSEANKCNGVMYGQSGLCGGQRESNDKCTKDKCPFLKEGKSCPYGK